MADPNEPRSQPSWPETPLHPVTVATIARARALGVQPFHLGSPEQARATYASARVAIGQGEAVREVRTLQIPTRGGAIAGQLCVPEGTVAGLCVYIHGGGWVVGALPDGTPLCRTVAARSGCAVLAVDYRLAPEHPFPAGLDDCEDALLWAWQHRAELAGADGPMVVSGDSAGGNLATLAVARVAGRVPLAGQVLIYPVADCDFDRPSYQRYGTGLPLGRADMVWFFRHYAPEERWTDPEVSALRGPVEALPPTVVLLAEHDVLRDEGEAYAARLAGAGKLVAVHRYPGVTHGFLRYGALIDTADRAVDDYAAAARRFCAG